MKEKTPTAFTLNSSKQIPKIQPPKAFIDLIIFLSVMFFVRTIHIESIGFWGNTLFKSIATIGVATVLLYYRKQSWRDIGLSKPGRYLKMFGVVTMALLGAVISIMLFELFLRDLLFDPNTETSSQISAGLSSIEQSVPYFLSIMLFVWIESFLEELQDRGFSLNRFESLFSKVPFSTMFAVLAQAAIFGFRHSYDFSPRSISTGLIALVFGAVYVLTGRNLWPLIIAHIFLNSMSVFERL